MQAHFLVYDRTTGEIKRHGKCPTAHVAAQARPAKNEAVREDQPRSPGEAVELMITHKVQAGKLHARPADEVARRRPKALPGAPGLDELLAVLEKRHGIKVTKAELLAEKAAKQARQNS